LATIRVSTSSDVLESRSREGGASRDQRLFDQRVVVTGAAGQLGRVLVPAARRAGATVIAFGSRPGAGIDVAVDLAERGAASRDLRTVEPDVIIHAAACTDVDGIEREPWRGERSNAQATQNVADAAKDAGAHVIAVSTDMVFPGDGGAPYAEDAATAPISVYGRSKFIAERAVLAADAGFAVARTAWLYGGAGKHFPRTVLTVLRDRGGMEVVDDEFGSPTYAGDLAEALVELAIRRGEGIFHLVNEGRASRYILARETARIAGFDPDQVKPISTAAFLERFPLPARRPADSTLCNRRAAALGITLRDWREAVEAYVPELAAELLTGRERASVGGGL
jgi:dTDP-4-dehydrorhamnose reductase